MRETESAEPKSPVGPEAGFGLAYEALGRVWREHPTLLLTLSYLFLTIVGLIYDGWYYRYFNINILDYSETSDFLLGAIRRPFAIVICFLPILLLTLGQRLRVWARHKSVRYDQFAKRSTEKWWGNPRAAVATYALFILVYAILFMQLYAAYTARNVKRGRGLHVSVERTTGLNPEEKPILFGTTLNFIFLYYPGREETEIVPVPAVSRLTVDSRRRREREADSGLRDSVAADSGSVFSR